jgi:hypothetical protein
LLQGGFIAEAGKDRSMIIDVGVCRDGDFAKV